MSSDEVRDDGASEQSLVEAAFKAHLERPLPKTEALIRSSGLSDKTEWLEYLRSTDLTDDEIAATLSPEPGAVTLAPKSRMVRLRRRVLLIGYELERLWNQQHVVVRLAYAASWLYLLIVPIAKLGLTLGSVVSAAIIFATKGWSFLNELKPKHMKLLQRNYDERKLAFHKLIGSMQLWYSDTPKPRERFVFQHEALKLIENYVRDHRYDLRRKIFVNLLVSDGANIHVINRADLTSRTVPQTYSPEECALAWRAIETGHAQVTGNVYEDFPGTVPGKKYVSVLVLPVRLGVRVLGAVSIDSEGKCHFDQYFEELQTALAPYVQLLALAMLRDHDNGALANLHDGADQ